MTTLPNMSRRRASAVGPTPKHASEIQRKEVLGGMFISESKRNEAQHQHQQADVVDLLLQFDRVRYQFPRPPVGKSGYDSGPEPEVFPPMDDVLVGAERATSKHMRAGLNERRQISPMPSIKSESDDKRRGIPIPGAATKKGSYDRRSCGLEMDSDAVLDELAAAEGGFNKDWQYHGRNRA